MSDWRAFFRDPFAVRFYGAIVMALIIMVALFGWALAHGDASWIMAEPRYRDARDMHCCGPVDCERVPAQAMIERDGGVEYVGHGFLPLSTKGHYRSIDGDWWACINLSTKQVKCVFHPRLEG